MDKDQSTKLRKGSKPRHYFPRDFFGDDVQENLHLMLPNFRRKRRQVKSVDTAKDVVVKNSQEFVKSSKNISESLHIRRASQRGNKFYQSPKLLSIMPGSFMRRNFSEQKDGQHEFKRSARNLYSKPLSLMSSMKKFNADLEDLPSTYSKPKAAKNLMKFYPKVSSYSAMKPDEIKKKFFFSKRKKLDFNNLPQNLELGPGLIEFQECKDLPQILKKPHHSRKIILPNLNEMGKCQKVALKSKFELGSVPSSPGITLSGQKSCSVKASSNMMFLSKCEKGLFKPWGPLSNAKHCTKEEMGTTAYFGGK